MKRMMEIRRATAPMLAIVMLVSGAMHSHAQTAVDDAAALEAQIKIKELQLKLLEADQALKNTELKTLEQSQKLVAAQRLLARQADAERLLDLQATSAVSGAQISNDLLLVTKLKDALGNAPQVGKEGVVNITDGSNTQLLSTRSGSASATLKLAAQICNDLKTANIAGAYVAPVGFDEKVVRSSLFMTEVDALKRYADNNRSTLDGVRLQSAAGVLAGLQVARYLIGGAQDLAKTFRSDNTFAISANNSRATLLEKTVSAYCPAQLANTDLETSLRLGMNSSTLSDSLNTLIDFVDSYDGKLAALNSQLAAAKEELAAEKAKPKEERSEAKIDAADRKVKGFQPTSLQLQLVEPATKRFKAFLESLKTREAQVIEALVWANFDTTWKAKPRLQLTVSAQDVQITKTSAWTSQKILAAAHVEALYHVIDKNGQVLVSGARVQSAAAPELELSKAGQDTFAGCMVAPGAMACP